MVYLKKNPVKRLQSAAEMKNQPVFHHVNWDAVALKNIPPPFPPSKSKGLTFESSLNVWEGGGKVVGRTSLFFDYKDLQPPPSQEARKVGRPPKIKRRGAKNKPLKPKLVKLKPGKVPKKNYKPRWNM